MPHRTKNKHFFSSSKCASCVSVAPYAAILAPTIFHRVAELHALLLYCFKEKPELRLISVGYLEYTQCFSSLEHYTTSEEVSILKRDGITGLNTIFPNSFLLLYR